MDEQPVECSVESDPDERDEHAYEDMWYRPLKARSDRSEDRSPSDEGDPPPTES